MKKALLAGLACLPVALLSLLSLAPEAQARYCIRTGNIVQCQ